MQMWLLASGMWRWERRTRGGRPGCFVNRLNLRKRHSCIFLFLLFSCPEGHGSLRGFTPNPGVLPAHGVHPTRVRVGPAGSLCLLWRNECYLQPTPARPSLPCQHGV